MPNRTLMRKALELMPVGRSVTTKEVRLLMGIKRRGYTNRIMHDMLKAGWVDKVVLGSEATESRWIKT